MWQKRTQRGGWGGSEGVVFFGRNFSRLSFLNTSLSGNITKQRICLADQKTKSKFSVENTLGLKYIETHLRWNLFCGFISVLLPRSLRTSTKKQSSYRRENTRLNEIFVTAKYVLIQNYLELVDSSVSINSICVTSVKCCVCCERWKATSDLSTSVSIWGNSVSKHSAVVLKRQKMQNTMRKKNGIVCDYIWAPM